MSETTDWEQHYVDEETPWDKGEAAPPLLEWMTENPGVIAGAVLVPGCGLGHDVRAIVSHSGGEISRAVGLDLSPTAVSMANEIPTVGCETFQEGDFFAIEEGGFDWVWEHTCFCAIDPGMRKDYAAAVARVLKPGGNFLAVFYLNPYDNEHSPDGGPPHGCSIEDLKELFEGKGGFSIVEQYVPKRSYPGREGLELIVRMLRI